jgi:4-amino-4-deoxy-L-arabinose transferase-like glycosyltransferase
LCALVFLLRAAVAFTLPLTGDEAYYWEWSRRLAFGYIDHPPAVAWTIAAFAHVGVGPGPARLGFLLCGVAAALALAGCATTRAGGDRRAGVVAALAFTLTPLASAAFGTVSPDGPYLMFWCLALYFAARAFTDNRRLDWILLGVALGGVLLSRIFGLALLFGLIAYALAPARRHAWREGFGLTLGIAFLVYIPFLAWNATHQWVTFTFALIHRHEGESGGFRSLLTLYAEQAAAFSPGIFVAAMLLAARPRSVLLAWTALPLLCVLTILALFRNVEMYWIWGAVASLCAMLGVVFVQLTRREKVAWAAATVIPAAVLSALLFIVTLSPVASFQLVHRYTGVKLHDAGPFEIYAFAPLAADVKRIARENHAVVTTDGYGLSSVLDFDAGVAPVIIGYDWQGREARAWYSSSSHPKRVLFVDKVPFASRPDFQERFAEACGRVYDGGAHAYGYGGTPPRNFYFTWCDGLKDGGLAILRWE